MKNLSLFILSELFLFCFGLNGQNPITVSLQDRPISELFGEINKQTGFPVYFHSYADTLRISVTADTVPAIQVLQEVLASTPYKETFWEDFGFFVLKNRQLITSLPEKWFGKSQTDNTRTESGGYSVLWKRKEKATSENKVYELGKKTDTQKTKVRISGQIINFKTGDPVVGTNLIVKDPWTATTSNSSGHYSLMLPTGKHEILISGFGIDTRRHVMVSGEGEIDIILEEKSFDLEEVVISANKQENVSNVQMSVQRLQASDIKRIPTAFGEADIIRALQSLPGVKTAGEASSGFNVRGGSTDQNLILFNNGTIYNPTHLFGFFSAINADMVKDMELYKSSIPVRYGGRLSSILEIGGKEANKEKFAGSAGIGLLTSKLTLEIPIIKQKTSLLVSGRTTYSDWILKKLPAKSGYNDGSAGFYDMGGVLSHKFSPKDNLTINGYYSRDNFSFNPDNKYNYTNANASINWKHIWNEKLIGTFTAGYDHYDYETQDSQNTFKGYLLKFDINQWFGKADFQYNIAEKHSLSFGLNALVYDVNPGTHLPASDSSSVLKDQLDREKAIESALYIGDTWEITPRLSVNAGIRFSMFNVLGPRTYSRYEEGTLPSEETWASTETANRGSFFKTYAGPEFRISGRYTIADNLSVKAGFNSMRQYIHKLSNSTVMSPTDTWKLSDTNIRPQQGSQIAGGIYWDLADGRLETSLEAYYKTMHDYLDYRNGAELVMNHHIETDVVNTQGRAYGIELMIKKPKGRLTGWASYTYSRTKLRQNDPIITEPVNNGEWYPTEYDKPHDVKLAGNFRVTERYSFSLNCDYSTGRPITLPISKYYDHELGTEMVYYSGRNALRVPDYFRMDFAINIEPSHKLTLLTHSSLSIGVYNLTARKNVYSIYYTSENGQINGYQMSIFGVPIPYITYNIKF